MTAPSRPLFSAAVALAVVLTGGLGADAVAQEPLAGVSGDGFAAARAEPVAQVIPTPAPAPVPEIVPPPLPTPLPCDPAIATGRPLGNWFAPWSLGLYSASQVELMRAFGRELSQEPDYGNIFDRQTPLPRASNTYFARPLTPLVAGPTPIINYEGPFEYATYATPLGGGTARGDVVSDSANLSKTLYFVPSSIPVRGQPTFGLPGPTTVTSADIGTHLFLEENVATKLAAVRVFSQLAGFVRSDGSATGRVPHLYGQLKDLVIGKADTFFSDARAFPNTIDLAGPNALVYVQHVLIGYVFDVYQWTGSGLVAGLSLEQPEPRVTPFDPAHPNEFTTRSSIPDVCTQARIEGKSWGHVQVASIVRGLGIENKAYMTTSGTKEVKQPATHEEVYGWGVQCTGMLHPLLEWDLIAADWLGFGGVCGRGIASYNVDLQPLNANLDAVFDAKDDLRALPLTTFFLSYTHVWPLGLRSTVVYSQVDLKSIDSPDLKESPYRRGRYVAANLIYEWDVWTAGDKPQHGRLFAGIEYLYGRKELLDGKYGDAHRVQFTAGAKY